jgi:hypothetical protein
LFFEGIRSERQLVELASLNLAHRWHLGYHLDEPLPDRSSLVKMRQRLGLPVFRRFFEHVVDLCADADLIWGREVLADATRVPGNASMDSLAPRLKIVVDDHLDELFGAEMRIDQVADDTATAPTRWDLLETCRLDPQRPPPLAPIDGSVIGRSVEPIRMRLRCSCAMDGRCSGIRITTWLMAARHASSCMPSRHLATWLRTPSYSTSCIGRCSGASCIPDA